MFLRAASRSKFEAIFGSDPNHTRYLVTLGQGEEEVPNRRTVPYRDFVASDTNPGWPHRHAGGDRQRRAPRGQTGQRQRM
jgi:hypothetical protein